MKCVVYCHRFWFCSVISKDLAYSVDISFQRSWITTYGYCSSVKQFFLCHCRFSTFGMHFIYLLRLLPLPQNIILHCLPLMAQQFRWRQFALILTLYAALKTDFVIVIYGHWRQVITSGYRATHLKCLSPCAWNFYLNLLIVCSIPWFVSVIPTCEISSQNPTGYIPRVCSLTAFCSILLMFLSCILLHWAANLYWSQWDLFPPVGCLSRLSESSCLWLFSPVIVKTWCFCSLYHNLTWAPSIVAYIMGLYPHTNVIHKKHQDIPSLINRTVNRQPHSSAALHHSGWGCELV